MSHPHEHHRPRPARGLCIEGDKGLLELVADKKYHRRLLSLVHTWTRCSREEAEDYRQAILLATFQTAQKKPHYEKDAQAYADGIARNVVLKVLRKDYKRRRIVEPNTESVDRELANDRRMSSLLNCREGVARILAILTGRSTKEQVAIALFYARGEPAQEIADELGVAEKTVYNIVSLVRTQLREQVNTPPSDDDDTVQERQFGSLRDWAESILSRFKKERPAR